jgi:hypothetical protein
MNKSKIIKSNMTKSINKPEEIDFKINIIEKRIIEIIRAKKFQKIQIFIRDGSPIRMDIEEEFQNSNINKFDLSKINQIIEEKEFQEVILLRKNGKNTLIKRRVPILLNN